MKNYKRLTSRIPETGKPCIDFIASHAGRIKTIDRLAELEDKIEKGEIVDKNEYLDHLITIRDVSEASDKELEFFVKYNARVRGEEK